MIIMEFIKNFLALILSTAVWAAGLIAILSVYYIIIEQDVFYFGLLLLCIFIISIGVLVGKYNVRVQAALEFPFGIFSL
jgi:hypothetical protein